MKSILYTLSVLIVFFNAAVMQTSAVMQPSRPTLPDFDKREGMSSARGVVTTDQQLEAGRLQKRVPEARVEFDPLTGAPNSISAGAGFLSGTNGQDKAISASAAAGFSAGDPDRATKAFLQEHKLLFGHGPEVLNRARVKREFVTPHNGLRTVVWEQQVDGIPLFEAILIAHTTRAGELVNLSSRFVADPERAADRGVSNRATLVVQPDVSARRAVAVAAENIGSKVAEEEIVPLVETGPIAGVGAEKRQLFNSAALKGRVEAKLVWLPMGKDRLRLCWDVILVSRARDEMYRVLVDVQTAEPMYRRCLTDFISDATYRVFTSDSPSPFSPGFTVPNSGQPALVARTLLTWGALDTNASPNGWIDDGVNETRGNNVDAHTDRNADDVADLPRPQGSPSRVFDFPLDLAQAPTNYTNAAVVQLFYWCNWMHDKLYELGFTEAAGNFQVSNFGRGGLGNDAVQADAQDGSGFNNANFSTPPDGAPGRMQMYVFTGPNPPRDGDLDAELIIHEYTHGLSNRRVGGGIGISALQTEGMGEGWSDFYALSLLSEATDNPNGVYAFGAYASYLFFGLNQNYYFGIRRYPYCTDPGKNPLTFKDIDSLQASSHSGVPRSPVIGGQAGEVHNMGEVWCVTLWEARANLISKYGWTTGNQLMFQLVTDGMNLAPPNPNFLQARDAILQADQVNTGGTNQNALWVAFASRGMGAKATAPASSTANGVHESFDIPDNLQITPDAELSFSSPGDGPLNSSCQAYGLNNTGSNPLSWVAYSSASWLSINPTEGDLAPGASNSVTVCLTQAANSLTNGTYTTSIIFSNATSGATQMHAVNLHLTPPRVAFFSLDTDPSWMREGQWEFGEPAGSGGAENGYPDPISGATGTNVFGVNLSGDYSTTVDDPHYLMAGPFDLSGCIGMQLQFRRWLNTDFQPFVYATIDVSNDGTNWGEVWNNGSGEIRDDAWTLVSYDISAHADNSTNVYVRWGYRVGERLAFSYSGWNIDDIELFGYPSRRLTLTIPNAATEGDGPLLGTVEVATNVDSDLVVILTSSNPSEVSVPDSVTIPAGQSNAVFSLTIVDDNRLDGTRTTTIKASALSYRTGSSDILVFDNETATLSVLLPATAAEGQGTLQGVVQLGGAVPDATEVSLVSSDTTELQLPASIIIPAGETSAAFTGTIPDDDEIDGPQTVMVTASATGWTEARASLTILDNESLDLTVTVPANAWENAGVLTNAGSVQISGLLQTNLVVSLFSSAPERLVIPATVTIPAGQTAGVFELMPVDNSVQDHDRTITITSSAPGFGDGTGSILILDDETPPPPANPFPADGDINISQTTSLSWQSGFLPGHEITNEIYFGTNPTPGPEELQGSTTNSVWELPRLAPQTTYYWQVVANQIGATAGPIWEFTTRGLDHFTWETISSPQYVSQPFAVTVIARDAYGNTVSNFTGTVSFQLLDGSLPPSLFPDNFPPETLLPTNSGNFADGLWTGTLSLLQPGENVTLVADDGSEHTGVSNPISVVLTNDISIRTVASPDPVAEGTNLTYTLMVTNTGATDATGVVVSNILPANVTFTSVTASQGSCGENNGIVTCDLGVVPGGTNATVTIKVIPTTVGITLTNLATVSRAESDPYLANNTVTTVTVVLGALPPIIVAQPTNQTVTVGGTASFSVVAEGTEPLSYQWSLNTTNLTEATHSLLVLTNVQLSDAGNYAVLVSNAAGAVPSSNALLTVNVPLMPPVIVVHPTNQTVTVGGTASFSVIVEGTQPLSYQWQESPAKGKKKPVNVVGATNSILILTNVQSSDAGNYAVLVTNAIGFDVSSNALLTLELHPVPPVIVVQPTNQSVTVGGTVNFSVMAEGTEPLSYQWTLNTTNLVAATNSLLILTNAQLSDAGNYAVQVTNAVGFDLSSNAMLTVELPLTPPIIVVQPTNQSVTVGGSVSFSVVVEGTEPLSYQWSLNTTNLIEATNSLLVLTNVQLSDVGNYAVLVTNAIGFDLSSNALLTVEVPLMPPVIVVQPTNQTVPIGGTANFSVVAEGTEPLSYQWSLNTTNLVDATNSLLVLTNVQLSDAGNYAVQVTNTVGFDLSSNAMLVVELPPMSPVIVVQPTNQTVLVGGTGRFSVIVEGAEPLNYQWWRNPASVVGGGESPVVDATNSDLTISNAGMSDSGWYFVVVSNSLGSAISANARLVVYAPDHFAWNSIPSPQFVNVPFAVTIQAQDTAGRPETNFIGLVTLTSTNGVPISPTVSGNFVQGTWTGSVAVSEVVSNTVLLADDGFGHLGFANAIDVAAGPRITVEGVLGNTILISWPAEASGFVLESCTDLAAPVWVPAPSFVDFFDGKYQTRLRTSGANSFYRLRFPSP